MKKWTIYFIRHGMTAGNKAGQYIGSTDEPLCPAGHAALEGRSGPPARSVFVSPMRRCLETAELLYPGRHLEIVEDLRESDFGAFERRTYKELKDDPAYQIWLDTRGKTPPPGGEEHGAFCARAAGALRQITARCSAEDGPVALVTHGGIMMALLEQFEARHAFYAWNIPNGGEIHCLWDGETLEVHKGEDFFIL